MELVWDRSLRRRCPKSRATDPGKERAQQSVHSGLADVTCDVGIG